MKDLNWAMVFIGVACIVLTVVLAMNAIDIKNLEKQQEGFLDYAKGANRIDAKLTLCIGDLYMKVLPSDVIVGNNLLEAINEIQKFKRWTEWDINAITDTVVVPPKQMTMKDTFYTDWMYADSIYIFHFGRKFVWRNEESSK